MMHRREFLERALKLSAAGLLVPSFLRQGSLLDPRGALAFAAQSGPNAPFAGRILVWVNYSGGNDGLNTVIPYADPRYYQLRPTLAVPQNQVIPLSGVTGLHPSLAALAGLYNQGKVAIIQGVGYPNMNLSHFRGTDIWFSGSSEDVYLQTGWVARFLEATYPDFPTLIPDSPYALQQSDSHRIPLAGERGLTGVIVDNPDTFSYLVGATYPGSFGDPLPPTRGGSELGYMRNLDQQTFEYAEAIQSAADGGTTTVTYPETNLGYQLEIVARLISGGLNTPIFLTSEYGFDTHAVQADWHPDLLASVGNSVSALWTDLTNQGLANKVLILTTSEFGRRPEENGSFGTDHGTSAPHFAIGNQVHGGIYGFNPNLQFFDPNGNLLVQHDYRTVYATVLRHHFGASLQRANQVLQGAFGTINFLQPVTATEEPGEALTDMLHAPRPNPISASAGERIEFRFDLSQAADPQLLIFDPQGRKVATVAEGARSAGPHQVMWEPRGLSAGTYLVRLQAAGWRRHAKLTLLP